MNEIKRNRFIRVMTNRVTRILDAISTLGNDLDWYWISADNGSTWTKQVLNKKEVMQQIADGFMLKKADFESKQPPKLCFRVVYDSDNCDLSAYSSAKDVDFWYLDTGSADPVDEDFEEHADQIKKEIDALEDAVKQGSLFRIC